jgi:hypothetical protein
MRLTEAECMWGLESADTEEERVEFQRLMDHFNAIDGWDKSVRVHIYTIDNVFNNWILYPLSIPVVHVGIHIEGFSEFTFNRQGIVEHRLGGAEQIGARIWTDTAHLGDVKISKAEIRARIDSLCAQFAPGTYSLTSHNCIDFVSAVAEVLGCDPIPDWSQRVAQGASMATSSATAAFRFFASIRNRLTKVDVT